MTIKTVFAYAVHPTGHSFGNGDRLPWGHIPQDMKWFRESTKDSVVIMGAKTWESLPKKLDGRVNVVIADPSLGTPVNKSGETADHVLNQSLSSVVEMFKYQGDVCIIGGLSLIQEGLELCDEAHVTVITPSLRSGFITTHFLSDGIVNYLNGSMEIVNAVSMGDPSSDAKMISKFVYKQA